MNIGFFRDKFYHLGTLSDANRKISTVLIVLNFYIILHMTFGVNNISSYFATEDKLKNKQQELVEITEINKEYEKEITMLQQSNLDYDYLDELIRLQLNYSYPDEKVIIYAEDKTRI